MRFEARKTRVLPIVADGPIMKDLAILICRNAVYVHDTPKIG